MGLGVVFIEYSGFDYAVVVNNEIHTGSVIMLLMEVSK